MHDWSERATADAIGLLRREGVEIDRSEILAETNRVVRLRRACVVTWCAARPEPRPAELDAIRHHLRELKL